MRRCRSSKHWRTSREGKWDFAEGALREAHALLSDKASLVLLERIEGFRRESPRNWEGIWSFETK